MQHPGTSPEAVYFLGRANIFIGLTLCSEFVRGHEFISDLFEMLGMMEVP